MGCMYPFEQGFLWIYACRIAGSSGHSKASLVAQMVKNLPAVQETQVRSLGQKDPLEKGMASILA